MGRDGEGWGLARLVNCTALLLLEQLGEEPRNRGIARLKTKSRGMRYEDIKVKYKAVIEVQTGIKTEKNIATEFNIPPKYSFNLDYQKNNLSQVI